MKEIVLKNKLFILTVIVIVLLFNIKLPFYIDTPGGVININNRITYKDKKEYKGSLNMLYVTEYVATVPTYLMSFILKDWDLEELKESQLSNESTEEIEYRNKIMLENSINAAKYVAYTEANKEIKVKNKKTIIIGTTIENELKIGDEILEINGQKVENSNEIKKIIEEHEVGEKLNIKINRRGREQEKRIEIKKINEEKVLGIVIVTNYEYEVTPKIELKFKQSESGPSGGMMMALSMYITLSEEDLLKGRNIAGTGTIDFEGNVGEIGGIKYKIIGAYKNHMDVVLVPSGNYKEALSVVKEKKYNMKIVEVKTLKDAIDYLKNN